ncbi:MAG: hypothetical protein CMN10_06625 [Roseobacter sp.]|nr:hypothetical protein [Roseobacter sp.]|tara:strand:- start:37421 stop:38095 length:675 start_codon:yes stop_codon:yes gene_type:complete
MLMSIYDRHGGLPAETFGPLDWYGVPAEWQDADVMGMPRGAHIAPPRAAWTRGDYISTYTGRFWPMSPRASEIDIKDIAHSLAMQCRYAGHVKRFLSVAEHSVHIARWLLENAPHAALHGLLHDAPEALSGFGDVARPVKPARVREIEDRVWQAVAAAFGLSPVMPDEVHEADNRIIADEMRQNMHECDPKYDDPLGVELEYWDPVRGEREFLELYRMLTGGRS